MTQMMLFTVRDVRDYAYVQAIRVIGVVDFTALVRNKAGIYMESRRGCKMSAKYWAEGPTLAQRLLTEAVGIADVEIDTDKVLAADERHQDVADSREARALAMAFVACWYALPGTRVAHVLCSKHGFAYPCRYFYLMHDSCRRQKDRAVLLDSTKLGIDACRDGLIFKAGV